MIINIAEKDMEFVPQALQCVTEEAGRISETLANPTSTAQDEQFAGTEAKQEASNAQEIREECPYCSALFLWSEHSDITEAELEELKEQGIVRLVVECPFCKELILRNIIEPQDDEELVKEREVRDRGEHDCVAILASTLDPMDPTTFF